MGCSEYRCRPSGPSRRPGQTDLGVPQPHRRRLGSSSDRDPQRQITVVVCDDAPQLRTLLRYAFEDEPDLTFAAEAGNGKDAIGVIADVQPDVVLLDLSMPQMDGLEAIPEIRRVSPGSAIIVFSGFTADGAAEAALAAGADRYLEKGTDINAVAVAVREVMAERGTR